MHLEHDNSIARDPERVQQASLLLREILKRKHVKIEEVPIYYGEESRFEIRFGWFYSRRILLRIEKRRGTEDGPDLDRIYAGEPNDLDVFMYVGWREAFYCRVPNFLLQRFLNRMAYEADKGLKKEDEKEIKVAKRVFGIYSRKLRLPDLYFAENTEAAWDFIFKNNYDTSKLSKWDIKKMHQEYLELKKFKKEHTND
jgi:hypothetical protein